jgi:hypothetical protein
VRQTLLLSHLNGDLSKKLMLYDIKLMLY